MNCKEVESLIVPFIKYQISDTKLEVFLNHIKNCPACYEELEIYYMVYMGMEGLDKDDFVNYDLKGALAVHLSDAATYLRNRFLYHVFKYSITTLAVIGLCITTLIQLRIWFF